MEFKLNSSPHLRMHEITKKLFNQKFLADITFRVEKKTIYAHSLELMKRSEVFENSLEETWGRKTTIPITDCKHDNFLEFLRFIYTDECEINNGNGMALLKLSVKYKIIMLQNQVINKLTSTSWLLSLYEYCVLGNYKIARNQSEHCFKLNYADAIQNRKYLALHPDAVKIAIQFDTVGNSFTEVQRFNALAKWINHYCVQHKMTVEDGRQKFDDFIRKIRFPIMSGDEMLDCARNYPKLLNENDTLSIAKQILFGRGDEHDAWISAKRNDYTFKYKWQQIKLGQKFETKISVAKQTILHGVWIGVEKSRRDLQIEITTVDENKNEIDKIEFVQSSPEIWDKVLVCLGDSLQLVPNFEYTIAVHYLNLTSAYTDVVCRDTNSDLIYNDPDNCIDVVVVSGNMLEIIFKSLNSNVP